MSKLRSLSTGFWSDPFVEDLGPSEKLLFIYLITNEKTNMLGIYEASIKKISFETGIKKETVSKALEGFERLGKVKYQDNYIILINYMKYQNYNTNMKKSAIDIYNSLPKSLKINNEQISKSNPSEGFETLLNHYGILSKREREVEREYEVEEEREEEPVEKVELLHFDFLDDDEVKKLVASFWEVKKKKKASLDVDAKNRQFKILEKFSSGNVLVVREMLRKSVDSGWSDLYPLKADDMKRIMPESEVTAFIPDYELTSFDTNR